MNVKWTEQQIEEIIKNYNDLSNSELATRFSSKSTAIKALLHRLGLRRVVVIREVKCAGCVSVLSTVRCSNQKYCSNECKHKHRLANKTRFCETCGCTYVADRKSKVTSYCSKICSGISRKSGQVVNCGWCAKEVYKKPNQLKGKVFCGRECANKAQVGAKVNFTCKMCATPFEVYPSAVKQREKAGYKVKYCSIKCRNADPEMYEVLALRRNNQNKNKAPNKLEVAGSTILKQLGAEFQTQHLMNGKISVDVFIPASNLVIEWWGDYWHGHPSKVKIVPDKAQQKRMNLDVSQRKYLETCGYKVLTFWEHEVNKTPEIVREKILPFLC